jgi:hypothetical protein
VRAVAGVTSTSRGATRCHHLNQRTAVAITSTRGRLIGAQLGLLLAAALVANASAAEKVPSEFQGVWIFTAESDNECRPGDWKGDGSDRLINVSSDRRLGWENVCDVKSVARPNISSHDDGSVQVTLACNGEGRRWNAIEIWHVQTFGQKKILAMTPVSMVGLRGVDGERMRLGKNDRITSSIYLACR